MAPFSSLSAVTITIAMMISGSNRTHGSAGSVPGMCEVGSQSHFVLTISTGEGGAGVRKWRFAPYHTADISNLGQEPHLSHFRSWGLHSGMPSLEDSFPPVLSSETSYWKCSMCA